MPRKQKIGLDYFYLQCDIFSRSSELRPLLQRYKADGIAVYLHILCDVYSNGYFFKTVDYDGYLLDIAEDCGITVNKVKLIVTFMQGVSLIYVKSNLTDKNTVITSHGIQRHYVEAMKYRKHSVAEIKGEYWLLNDDEEAELDTFYKSQPSENKSEIYADKSEIYTNKSEIYATKEIKGNKRKVNKKESKKEKDIEIEYTTHAQIMDDFGVSPILKQKLTDFLKGCYLNGHIVPNDKLEDIIVRLDMAYGQDEQAKCDSVQRAMSGGYFDIAEGK